jgi:peroxiredoxin
MGGTGKVNFPVTTKVAEVQAFVNQGVGQLHGFWYFEAERSFRQAAALDPTCPMTYWGMAMANINNQKRAAGFIRKAVEHKQNASRREALWIDAYAKFYRDATGDPGGRKGADVDKERRRDLVRDLENISEEFPQDVEAKAFLAFHVWDNSSRGWPIPSHQAVDALIKEVLAVEPLHPVHHCRIHLWDMEKPARALDSAARCGQAAPRIAHMWHMPGHVFSQLHRYADAAWHQEAAARVDHAYMIRDRVLPDQIHEYAHNNQWLVENLGFVGRVHDAVALAKNMIELPRHPRYNSLRPIRDSIPDRWTYGSARLGRNRLFEVLLRYELWDELIALGQTPYLEPTDIPTEQVKRLRALGVAHFSTGDPGKGHQQIAALEALRDRPHPAGARPGGPDMRPFVEFVEAARTELRGYAHLARGEKEKARELFAQAKDIPPERLIRVWLRLGENGKAEQMAREAVARGENRVHLLANLIDVLQRGGKKEEAHRQFERLRQISASIDLDVPVMKRLAPLAKELGWPADWRVPAGVSPEAGQRPRLEDLGPFCWQPPPAPDWSLPDAGGWQLSLKQYRGKPVVLIFYLGHACPHCLAQLNAFESMEPRFAAAGISLVAISTDSVEGLQRKPGGGRRSAFPLLSDSERKVFKAYRTFDDFENTPLHGTFLIDGAGRVRWQDISYEPFADTQFLLDEVRRLLSLKSRSGAPGAAAR